MKIIFVLSVILVFAQAKPLSKRSASKSKLIFINDFILILTYFKIQIKFGPSRLK